MISPNNRTFPPNFSPGRLTTTFIKKEMGGNPNQLKQDVYLNVSSPYTGYWFSAAFVDSNEQKVKPDLLRSNCSFYLTASVSLWQLNDTIVIYPNQTQNSPEHTMFKIYKYLSTAFDGPLRFVVLPVVNLNSSCKITSLLRQSAFPDMVVFTNNDRSAICDFNNNSSNLTDCRLAIDYPMTNTWYYIGVASECPYALSVILPTDCVAETQQTLALFNQTFPSLMSNNFLLLNPARLSQYCSKLTGPIETFRFIGPTYFSLKYYFNSNYNRSNALLVRNEKKPYFIEFLVDLANNGGTLSIYIVNNLIFDPSYDPSKTASNTKPPSAATANAASAETKRLFSVLNNVNDTAYNGRSINNQSETVGNENVEQQVRYYSNQFRANAHDVSLADVRIMLHACLLFNSMSSYENCPPGYKVSVQSYTSIFSNIQMNVPYPMMGKWYLAIWKECFNINTK